MKKVLDDAKEKEKYLQTAEGQASALTTSMEINKELEDIIQQSIAEKKPEVAIPVKTAAATVAPITTSIPAPI